MKIGSGKIAGAWLVCFLFVISCSFCLGESVFATLASSQVTLRAAPDGFAAVTAQYEADTWVLILNDLGDWAQVQAEDGQSGYIWKQDMIPANVSYAIMAVVNNPNEREYLNLRAAPSIQAEVLGIYYNGVPAVILSHDTDSGWYRVSVDGLEGYFREEYVSPALLPCAEAVATVHLRSGANLRSGPGFTYPATKLCSEGTYLTVLRKGKNWSYVSDHGTIGFIRSDALYEGVLNPVYQEERLAGAVAIVSNPKPTQVLNMRALPSKRSESLAQYSNGTSLTLLAQGMIWCRVTDGEGHTGWCMTEFLRIEGGEEEATRTVSHPNHSFVNLRAAPSAQEGRILGEVPHGTKVLVLIPDLDGWTLVRWEGLDGYMSSSFLQ